MLGNILTKLKIQVHEGEIKKFSKHCGEDYVGKVACQNQMFWKSGVWVMEKVRKAFLSVWLAYCGLVTPYDVAT